MNIKISNPNFQGKAPIRKLVPASQLQGLRLQLTEAETSRVQDLQKQIAEIERNIEQTKKQMRHRKYTQQYKQQFKKEMTEQKKRISTLQETIRNIKIKRFAEQKRAAGLDVNV